MRNTLLLSGLALATLVSSGWALFEHAKNARFEQPFLDYGYDAPRDLIIAGRKSIGELESIAYDRNGDRNDDSIVVYGKGERISTIWVDEDLNGILEVEYLYSPEGRLLAIHEDIGQDGFVEQLQHFTTDSVFTYRDLDHDGYYSTDERIRSEIDRR